MLKSIDEIYIEINNNKKNTVFQQHNMVKQDSKEKNI